jgi:hypothetical protein
MSERDYPVGHPAASDYSGQKHAAHISPFAHDYPPGHAARGGQNSNRLSTPDGMRTAHNSQKTDLQELAMVGSLPPLIDDETGKAVELSSQQLAHVYAVRNAIAKGQLWDRQWK